MFFFEYLAHVYLKANNTTTTKMMMMKMMMSQHHHEGQVSHSQTTKFKSFLNNNASLKELRRSPTKVVNRLSKKKNEHNNRRKQHHARRDVTRACGIIGVMTHENKVSAELY